MSAPENAHHRDDCAVTPIYAQTFADTGQPRYPWTWPWLVTDFPECSCDDEPQFCEIHGEPEWRQRYTARWGASAFGHVMKHRTQTGTPTTGGSSLPDASRSQESATQRDGETSR